MKIKKLGALLVSAALCAGMAAPAFAFEGEAAPVEQPVLLAADSSLSRWCRNLATRFIWSSTAMLRDSRPFTL